MIRFYCQCGKEVFFESHLCNDCNRSIGYDVNRNVLLSMEMTKDATQFTNVVDNTLYRFCTNRISYNVCNGLIPVSEPHNLCRSCRLNRTIPDTTKPKNLRRWKHLEQAKRRLIFGLLYLRLPLTAPVHDNASGLTFDFLEDQRSNPNVAEKMVTTSHKNGLITLNILEADEIERAWQRHLNSESYRTLLGHFRHEVGHYYYQVLMHDQHAFSQLFGDPNQSYNEALKLHYANGPLDGWQADYISAYASSHPLEDWAECFAHYLHTVDTLQTAHEWQLIPGPLAKDNFQQCLQEWDTLAVILNELNRSLGLRDAYPFAPSPRVSKKLSFVHQQVLHYTSNRQLD